MKSLALCLCTVAFLAACRGEGSPSAGSNGDTSTPTPTISPAVLATALIATDGGSVLVRVEIADDEEEREKGLMDRDSLPDDQGMAFIFFQPTNGSFWMKNTRIPLSIAFFDGAGKIVRILDMKPCTEDPCPLYSPNVTYHGALEVNQGAFEEWGVEVGDRITITQ